MFPLYELQLNGCVKTKPTSPTNTRACTQWHTKYLYNTHTPTHSKRDQINDSLEDYYIEKKYIGNNILNVQTNEFTYVQKLLSYKTTNIENFLDI
jgi:hypothetical protein